MIEKNKTFLMLKIFTPPNISFYEEHQKILNTEGYVWFCRLEKVIFELTQLRKMIILFLSKNPLETGITDTYCIYLI